MMLLLVRHGETEANRCGLLLGRADPDLTAAGRAQTRTLASILPHPDRVISSPLRRARQSAELFGRSVEVDERWIELDYGEFDRRAPDAIPAEIWDRWRTDAAFAPPGGESMLALSSRVVSACDELTLDAVDSTVVVVTHVSPIKAALAWALDVPVESSWRMFVEDGSVSRIEISPEGPVVHWFNRGLL